MAPSVLPLVLAATLKVALPAFEAEQLPNGFAERLPEQYAAALEERQCVIPLGPKQLGAQPASEFADCGRDAACLSLVGRVVGAKYVVLGQVLRTDSGYSLKLGLLDVKEKRVTSEIEHKHTGKLVDFEKSIKKQAPSLCKALDPSWSEAGAADQLAALSFEAPTVVVKPKDPPPPVVESKPPPKAEFDELPPMPPDEKVQPAPKAETPPKLAAPEPDDDQEEEKLTAPTVQPKPRRFPWAWVTGAAAVATAGVGIGLGVYSKNLWSENRPVLVNGVTVNSLSHVEAVRANNFAYGANAMFIAAGVLALTTGTLIVTQSGLGYAGQF